MKKLSIIITLMLMLSYVFPISALAENVQADKNPQNDSSVKGNQNQSDSEKDSSIDTGNEAEADSKNSEDIQQEHDADKEEVTEGNGKLDKNEKNEQNSSISDPAESENGQAKEEIEQKESSISVDEEKKEKNEKHEDKSLNSEEKDEGTLKNETKNRTLKKHSVLKKATKKVTEKDTNKLGHIKNSDVKIYKDINDLSSSFAAGSNRMGKVYYITKKAAAGGVYYLLSEEASSVNGVVGWVKKSDVDWHTRKVVDRQKKIFYSKGTGKGYKRAWGGSKEVKLSNLSKYKNDKFVATVTVQVGKQLWYRGKLGGRTVWVHMNDLVTVVEKDTNKLGHIKNSNVKIYKDINDLSSSFAAGSNRMGKVYYITKKAAAGGVYYLLSEEASSVNGVVGWVKKSDVDWHTRKVVDRQKKIFYSKGTGKGYKRAWGGSKEVKLNNLSKYKNDTFIATVTVQVGKQLWYRGKLGGRTVWVHMNDLVTVVEKNTNKLGHIKKSNAKIYKDIGYVPSSFKAGNTHMGKVYYITKKAAAGGTVYYLLSEEASSVKGVVGWIKKSDVDWHTRTVIDRQKKTFYSKGTGKGYKRAWGGSKEVKLSNLSKYKNDKFVATVTVQVGKQLWYRGKLGGRTVWIHESHLAKTSGTRTKYNLTLDQAVNIQMKGSPQTDGYTQYVSSTYVKYSNGEYYVTADVLNVRKGPGTSYAVDGQVYKGNRLSIKRKVNGWYQLYWVNAKASDVRYYLDPNNFINDPKQKFQFLDLSKKSGATVTVLNKYLKGKGTLAGQGKAFIDAGNKHGVNDVYLLSHALLETGNGTSKLAKGVKYKGKTVYNMFGVGAYDSCPIDCGAKKAFDEGWTTPYKAIVGGAAFIGNEYIKGNNSENRKLNTLYKMRWNPGAMNDTGRFGKQYATDIGWASKQIDRMYNLYQQLDSYTLYLDIPEYK